MPAIYSKPCFSGTSNTRQATKEGKIRGSDRKYHGKNHRDCDASSYALDFMVASAPGLSLRNWHNKTVLGGDGDGMTLKQYWASLMDDPIFNGFLVFWMLDNDNEFLGNFDYDQIHRAVKEYLNRVSEFISGLRFVRLYLTSMPIRQSDFIADKEGMSDFLYKVKFNNEMRKIFAQGEIKINGIPTSLIDLNEIHPEYTMQNDVHYCGDEISRKFLSVKDPRYNPFPGVHYNAKFYKRVLEYIINILNSHKGLPRKLQRGSNPTMFNQIEIEPKMTFSSSPVLSSNAKFGSAAREKQPKMIKNKPLAMQNKGMIREDCSGNTAVLVKKKNFTQGAQVKSLQHEIPQAMNDMHETVAVLASEKNESQLSLPDLPDKKSRKIKQRRRWNHSSSHISSTFDLFRLFRRIIVE